MSNRKETFQRLPLSVGNVSFIRLVSAQGTIKSLEQPYQVGKRLKFESIKATIVTQRQTLKVYHRGRLRKPGVWPRPGPVSVVHTGLPHGQRHLQPYNVHMAGERSPGHRVGNRGQSVYRIIHGV
jgi:hypothetical protein